MAKKKFNVSGTLQKNTVSEPKLAPKIPLRKANKNFDEVKEKVEELHSEEQSATEKAQEKSTATPPKTKTSATQSKRKTTTKKAAAKEEPTKIVRLTIDTPAEIHTQLKIKAVLSGVSMRDYILRLLEKELGKS